MKERIKHFIEVKGISAGELAVIVDVQRSNISHILNGRNKPSATFIEKLLNAFPDLNARWLLTGNGEMQVEGSTRSAASQQLPFIDNNNKSSKVDNEEKEKEEEEDKVADTKSDEKTQTEEVEKVPLHTIKSEQVKAFASSDIESIVIFYKDGSFASYNPR